MRIPVTRELGTEVVGYLEVDDATCRGMLTAFVSGIGCSLGARIHIQSPESKLMEIAIKIGDLSKDEPKPEPPKMALTIEPIGGEPRLKIGDVVKVDEIIGVVSHAYAHPGAQPNYDIAFVEKVGLKCTGWKITEIDEVVSLGPFHGKG